MHDRRPEFFLNVLKDGVDTACACQALEDAIVDLAKMHRIESIAYLTKVKTLLVCNAEKKDV